MLKCGYTRASNVKPIWFKKVHNFFTLLLCIHFPSFIIQGIHRIPFLFSGITEHLDFSVVYWLQTTIDDFYHDLLILLQELIYPIIFMIVVALALRDITYEVGVKFINRVKAQCINGLELITMIYDRLSIGFTWLLPPLTIKIHVPVMIHGIVIIIYEDHVYD